MQERDSADFLDDPPPQRWEVSIATDSVRLPGDLVVPDRAHSVVIFAHGSGSSRHSPRNRHVAAVLNESGLATLLLDLLSPTEETDRRNVFDIGLLASRLGRATEWVAADERTGDARICYFGASTGAAAALTAAAAKPHDIAAVVSRGGRPDLAANLARVRAPTLLIVGGNDPDVLGLNRSAQGMLRCTTRLEIVPGATHLFEEPGALDTVAHLAAAWYQRYSRTRSRG